MRSAHKAAASVAAVAIVTAGSFAAGHQAASPSTAVCHYQADGALPDPSCTPGATNPDVTDTAVVLKRTICKSGWTKTIRPSVSVTNALKTQQMALYGAPPPRSLYEEDHLISLQLGGSPDDPRNLWPEPYAGDDGARRKDTVETFLKRLVCAGKMALRTAQRLIAGDWRRASG